MNISLNEEHKKNALILMQSIFKHDIVRLVRIGYYYIVPGILNDEFVKILTEFIMIFFDLLQMYSRGKTLTIQTDRRITRKKKKKANKKKK